MTSPNSPREQVTQASVKRPLPKAASEAPTVQSAAAPAVPAPKASSVAGPRPMATQPARPVAAGHTPAGKNGTPQQRQEDGDEEHQGGSSFQMWLKTTPSWLTSTVLHMIVLLIMAVWITYDPPKPVYQFVATATEKTEEIISDVPEEITEIKSEIVNPNATMDVVNNESPVTELPEIQDNDFGKMKIELEESGDPSAYKENLLGTGKGFEGQGLGARTDGQARARALAAGGGTPESEKAVAMALEWLARHQLPDGGWSFDHRLANHPNGRNPGSLKDPRVAPTGLALMAFLGAGHTHKQGKHKKVVERGLYFLCSRVKPNGSMHEPGAVMYGHGIGSIALCEAYAMTQDKTLKGYAQSAVNFIVAAQDRVGGGWRYEPGQPGDTSVVGWQLMALKSAHMAYLAVPPQAIAGANNFLNIVQSDSGSRYGYTGPGGGAATTAIGLLCRMYLGWKKENGALDRGVEFLSQLGPSRNEMYYNYYATQVLHHWEGERWKKWNEVMRDHLINTQEKQGDEMGSWFFNGGHGAEAGGRLYNTCMAAMTLEVYYRHSPIYRKQSTEDEFDQ